MASMSTTLKQLKIGACSLRVQLFIRQLVRSQKRDSFDLFDSTSVINAHYLDNLPAKFIFKIVNLTGLLPGNNTKFCMLKDFM